MKYQFPDTMRSLQPCFDPVWNRVCSNPDTVPASQHKQVFSDSLYLVPLFSLEFIRPCFDVYIKILPGEAVCSQALGSRSLELQACEACCSISLQRTFCLLSIQAQKALWHPSNLSFFHGLSVIISLPVRILAGNYNGSHFQGSHFMTM